MARTKAPPAERIMHFVVETFPGCCGVRILVGLFMNTPNAACKHNNWEGLCGEQNVNSLIAVSTQEMTTVNEYLATQVNWTRVELPRNPNTGNILYLWTYEKADLLEFYEEDEDEDDY